MSAITPAELEQIEKRLKHLEQTSDIGGLALHAVKFMPALIEIAKTAPGQNVSVLNRQRVGA